MVFSIESRCKIDNKYFFLGPDKTIKKGKALLRENSRDNWHALSLEPQMVVWIRDVLDMLIDRPNNQKFFMQRECENGTCWVQKVTNRRGMFADISKVSKTGEKSNLYVPAGINKDGWRTFVNLIDGKFEDTEVVRRVVGKQAFVKESISFAEAVEGKKPIEMRKKHFTKGPKIPTPTDSEETECIAPLNLLLTVVVTKRCFHDDWGKILASIRKCTRLNKFEINSFHPDKALLKCSDKLAAANLCSNRLWSTFEGVTLKFEVWDCFKHNRMDLLPCYGGWIKVRNIPLIHWGIEVFKVIGDLCGGYIKCSKNTLNRIGCFEAVIMINSNSCGFIPAEIEVKNSEGISFIANIAASQNWKMLEKLLPTRHGLSHQKSTSRAIGGEATNGLCTMDISKDRWKSDGPEKPVFFEENTVHQQCSRKLTHAAAHDFCIPVQNNFNRLFVGEQSSFDQEEELLKKKGAASKVGPGSLPQH